MNHLLFETDCVAGLQSIPKLRHLLAKVIQKSISQQTLRRRILLCLSEAVTNLVQYAKLEDCVVGKDAIGLRFGHNNIGWWLEIMDYGSPWDPTNQTASDIGEILCVFEMKKSGRGLALLHNQCDQLDYQAGDAATPNRLHLTWFAKKQKQRPLILLVEDEQAMSRLYAAYLCEEFDVEIVNNGYEALQQISQQSFDLMLSDICMPEMNGLSLRDKLNNAHDAELIPFIFLTAVDDADMKQQATRLGVDDYLIKPVKKTQLVETIKRVINRTSQVHQQLNERIEKHITASLVPHLPSTSNGWRHCVASRHTGLGGGDFLLQQQSDNHLMLMLADIMGHDDSAKFFAFAYAGYLHGLVKMVGDLPPSKLLEKLSEDALQDELLSRALLTCCAVTLSPNGRVTMACAGHPPPLLISSTGVQVLPVSGTLPGLTPSTKYQCLSKIIVSGERLVLYTDGLFESANDIDGRLQLETKIMQTLNDTLDRPIDDSLEIAMDMFDQIAGSPPQDDALLVLLEPV